MHCGYICGMENYNGRIFNNADRAKMVELRLSGLTYYKIYKHHGYSITSVKSAMRRYHGVMNGNKMITLESKV